MKHQFAGNRLFEENEDALKANIDRVLGALGLAMNAGGLAVGTEAVSQAIARGNARIVFLTSDISKNSREKLMQKLIASETRYIVLPCGMPQLAARLGKTGLTSSAALTKAGFEKIIFKCMDKYITAKSVSENTVKSHDNTTEVH